MVTIKATGFEQMVDAYLKNVCLGKREANFAFTPAKKMQNIPVMTKHIQPSKKFVTLANVRGIESTATAIGYEATK